MAHLEQLELEKIMLLSIIGHAQFMAEEAFGFKKL